MTKIVSVALLMYLGLGLVPYKTPLSLIHSAQ